MECLLIYTLEGMAKLCSDICVLGFSMGIVMLILLLNYMFLGTIRYLDVVCAGMDFGNQDLSFLACLASLQLKYVL